MSVRFPIPDLRSDQERGPWFKKSLQKEILHLEFTDIEFKTEFIGGSTPEQVKLELTFKELTGKCVHIVFEYSLLLLLLLLPEITQLIQRSSIKD